MEAEINSCRRGKKSTTNTENKQLIGELVVRSFDGQIFVQCRSTAKQVDGSTPTRTSKTVPARS